ncbi:MAG: prolipoprotein diacylglyceryl transferase [Brevundimonas sp.]
MPFPEFDPVLIQIGPFPLRWYALAYVAGIGLGWWYAARLIKTPGVWPAGKPPITTTQLDDLVLWIAVGIIAGGRLGYALFYKPSLFVQIFGGQSWGERLEILQVWTGGMSFHGGFIGVALAVLWFARKNDVRLLSIADLVAPVVPLGLFFGRLANFINGELWGRVTDVPWAIRFCNERILQTYGFCPAGNEPRHPSQLYEAGLEGLLLFVLLWFGVWRLKLFSKPGFVTGIFLLGYGLSRALLETVREPDLHMPEALRSVITMGMLLSIPMIIAGAWLIQRARSRPPVAE